MKDNVIKFPEPKKPVIQGYRMSFYLEKEIDLALLCLNVYGFSYKKYDRKSLKQLDPLYIKECMIRAYNSDLLSTVAKKVIMRIIDNMEEIAIPATKH
tara:strand:- start:864 stop:1157 length:294 start_codon:yes stop_codon:yes gene_type:complete